MRPTAPGCGWEGIARWCGCAAASSSRGWTPPLALFARKLGADEPEEALDWAGRIADEELRWGTVGQIAREWLVMDEPAAKAWIERSELPEPYRSKTLVIPRAIRRQVTEREAARTAEEAADLGNADVVE